MISSGSRLVRYALSAAAVASILAACGEQREEGALIDTRDNILEQGIVDCTEHNDTGYSSGDAFTISVVTVDGKPVEVDTANAYYVMQQAAASDGVQVRIVSGFRTMAQQEYLYGCYVNCNCNNCNLAASPGYSNHQSGHALDLNTSDPGVLNWLNAHGAAFGFERTVPSEAWHWEWWGGGPGGGPCGASPECLADASYGGCDGSVITHCDETNHIATGDCGAFGATCSTEGGAPHCVHPFCTINLGDDVETGTFCVDDTKLATCNLGQYSEGDCAAFGGTCSNEGDAGGHCVHFMCWSNLDGAEDGSFCVDDTKVGNCTLGVFAETTCGEVSRCGATSTGAACIDARCIGGADASWCSDEGKLASCTNGTFSESECAAATPCVMSEADQASGTNGTRAGCGEIEEPNVNATGGGKVAMIGGDDDGNCAQTSTSTSAGALLFLGALGAFGARRRRRAFTRASQLASQLASTAAMALVIAATSACLTDVDRDEDEPIDDRSNELDQGVYNCSESSATGYRNGNSFPIKVVKADNKPVQLDTANAYIAMQKKAKDSAGVSIRIVSGFRTNSEQQYLYGCYVNCNCNNCNLAARPGFSNHQSGHALDLNTSDPGVLSWLNAHGDEYGFARTVPSEPWHWEYWGAVDFDGPCGGPQLPQACVSGNFDGEFCDDDRSGSEDAHDFLKNELGVDFHCSDISGEPAYCGNKDVTRAQSISVLGRAADMPVNGHPNAFRDDNGHGNEKSLNAAKAFGILLGDGNGNVNPNGKATRNTLAIMMKRMYLLPPADRDYFDDDDGSSNEDAHNRVAAAGLFSGFSDDNGGRKDFRGSSKANRSTLAVLAKRAYEKGLVPVWEIPQPCIDGDFDGLFCDDDGSAAAAHYERLITEAALPGMYGRDLAGSPTFRAEKEASRAMSVLILTGSAGIPLNGHPDAFRDDDDHPRERYFDAAKAFGIVGGYDGGTKMKPSNIATRDTAAIILARMYALEEDGVDYFTDDDGDASEHWHNKVGAAGLFTGYSDGNGGRQFRGDKPATKGMLATLAFRAKEAQLVPVWAPVAPQPDDSGGVPEEDPAVDDLGVDDENLDDDGNALPPSDDDLAVGDDDPESGQPIIDDDEGADIADQSLIEEGALEGPPVELDIAPIQTRPTKLGGVGCNSAGTGSLITIFTLLPLLALIAGRRRGMR